MGMRSRYCRGMGVAALLAACACSARAADVRVVGVSANRAVVSIDGGAPRTLAIGQKTGEGVTLLGVDGEVATFDIDGRRRALRMGQMYQNTSGGASTVTLKADARGHFLTGGTINGASTQFLVDTGATLIAIPGAEARRLGIAFANAPQGTVKTAGGAVTAYKVRLDTVRVGGIELNGVDAVVLDQGLEVVLLGMSFLNRTEMRRDGETMVLTKRF
jgi:aspartyl protease family protein